jgi:uncharacterized membrane protein YcaP (DUF421 family)
MKPEEINITDIQRIIIGDVPVEFLLEVLIRLVFLFFILILAMRLMGRRMASTLSRNELAALVSLAAAIGVPMQDPARGLLPAVLITVIVVGVQRSIALGTFKSKKFERIVQDDLSILIENGCVNLAALKETGLSKQRVFAELRSESIINLGKVQRLYLESTGKFSLIQQIDPGPGLPIIPDWDEEAIDEDSKIEGLHACGYCGNLIESPKKPTKKCQRCNHYEWKMAVKS